MDPLPIWGDQTMQVFFVILRDFPYYSVLFGLVI